MPQGYYDGASGTTQIWVQGWSIEQPKGFWAWLNEPSQQRPAFSYDAFRVQAHLFLPYSDMHLSNGTQELKFQVGVYRRNNCLASSNATDFSLSVRPA